MQHFRKYVVFYVFYLVFLAFVGALLIFNEKAELHLFINSFHSAAADFFFRYYTETGGSLPFIVGAALIFYKYRAAILVIGAQLLAGLATQIAKRIYATPRPKTFFAEHFPDIDFHKIAGVHLHSSNSFPSGHTAAAFALFLSLAFLTKNKMLQMLYCILAMLVAYSRVYLSQHFSNDVFFGSIIGVVMTFFCWFIIQKSIPQWGEKSLCDIFCKKNWKKV